MEVDKTTDKKALYATDRQAKRRQGLQNMALATGALLIALLALEAVLALFYPLKLRPSPYTLQRYFCQYDATLGWRGIPNASTRYSAEDFDTMVHLNSKGLRSPELPYAKPPGTRRVVILGDSFAWGSGVGDHETFAALLGQRLKGKVEVLNLGLTGYGSDQSLLMLSSEGLKYSPDLVLYAFYPNDIEDNGRNFSYGYPKPMYLMKGREIELHFVPVASTTETEQKLFDNPPTAFGRLKKYLRHNLHSYVLFTSRVNSVPALRKLIILSGFGEPFERNYKRMAPYRLESFEDKMDLTFAIIREMRRVAESAGAGFMLIGIPMKEDNKAGALGYKGLSGQDAASNDLFSYHFGRFAEVNAIPYLDLLPEIRAAQQRGQRIYHIHDDHFSTEGHELAARLISDKLPLLPERR